MFAHMYHSDGTRNTGVTAPLPARTPKCDRGVAVKPTGMQGPAVVCAAAATAATAAGGATPTAQHTTKQ